jgi:serine/threonine-protein kinase
MGEKPRVPTAGEMVAGKYRVVRVIGEGGMGVVVEAEHIRLRQRAAIKFLSPEMLENTEIVERFEREARAASEFNARNNPHVVRVTDVDATPDGLPYMVMELLSGTDLES